LDNSSLDFKELNEFIDRKNLDPLGYYLINTHALTASKTKMLFEKNFENPNFLEIIEKVKLNLFILIFD
jgi:hypothetical protein